MAVKVKEGKNSLKDATKLRDELQDILPDKFVTLQFLTKEHESSWAIMVWDGGYYVAIELEEGCYPDVKALVDKVRGSFEKRKRING